MSEVLRKRGRVNALQRHRPADDPDLYEARRELRAASAEETVRGLVAGWPPLTSDQRTKLAALLAPTAADPTPPDAA